MKPEPPRELPPDPASAVGELFDEHARRILLYLNLRTDLATAEDLLSETFVIALEQWPRFDTGRDPLPWLWGIATNLLRRHWRHQSRTLRALSASAVPEHRDDVMSASERLDYQRALDLVLRELRRMRPIVRETVLLYAWAELTYEQIGEVTNAPIGTVRSRINRARSGLRDIPNLPFPTTGDAHA